MGPSWHARARTALLALLLVLPLGSVFPGATNPPAFAQAAVGATLSVLSPPVDVAQAGGGFATAQDGQTLRPGDQVRTGASGIALLTFFDGSETQLTGDVLLELDTASRGVFQTSGTTVHRVRVPSGIGFHTDTPPATAFVRGTTYVVTVKRLPVAPTDAGSGAVFPRYVDDFPDLLMDEVEFVDDNGEAWRKRTWQDVETETTWDTYDDLGPADQTVARLSRARPPGAGVACARTDVAACLVSAVLLADPDGRVGHVSVAPNGPLPPVDLTAACQVGAVAALVGLTSLEPRACAQLQQSVLNLRDVAAARQTQRQAEEIAREVGGSVAPGSPPPPPGPPPPGGTGQLQPPSLQGPGGAPPGGSPGAGDSSPGAGGSRPSGPDSGAPPGAGGGSPGAGVPSANSPHTWTASADTRFGIDDGYRNPAVFADTGATWERLILAWPAVQPTGPADFSHLDQTLPSGELEAELRRGVRPAGLLQFTPSWAQAHPEQGQRSAPKNLYLPADDPNNYFARYVYETVKHYAGRIDEWIVWNEPEFKIGDMGGGGSITFLGTDAEFAQLLKVAYLAVKRANPNAVISFPGTSYWVDRVNGRGQFYDRLLMILGQDPEATRNNWYHDVVALNLYRNADDVLRVHALYKEIQRRHGLDKPLWLTEANAMPTDDTLIACRHADDPIWTTMEQQAAYAIQAFAMAASAGYQRAGFYQMIDDNPCLQVAVWGAARDDGSRRPVAEALRTAITNFTGFSRARFIPLPRPEQHWAPWPEDPDSYVPNWQVYQVAFDKPGNVRLTVLWNGDAAPACVRLPRSGATVRAVDKRGAPVVVQQHEGWWELTLGAATAHFSGDPSGYFFIGGDPILVFEDSVDATAPVLPPRVDCS